MRLRIMFLFLFMLMPLWKGSHTSAQGNEWEEALIALNDPGLTAVYEAGLITPLSESQTKDDFTVTLLWGYADAARMNIGLRIDIPDTLIQQYPAILDGDRTLLISNTMVVDEDGNTYLFDFGSEEVLKASERSAIYNVNYQMNSEHTLSDKLELTLVGTVILSSVTNHVNKEMIDVASKRPFDFNFEVVYQGGYSLRDNNEEPPLLQVTDSDIKVSLTQFTVAPSYGDLEYCVEIPYVAGGIEYSWGLAYTIALDGDEDVVAQGPGGSGGGGGGGGTIGEPISSCSSGKFYLVNPDPLTGDWSIQVKQVNGYHMGPMPAEIEKLLDDGVSFKDLTSQLIESRYLIQYEGNWSFTIHFEDPNKES